MDRGEAGRGAALVVRGFCKGDADSAAVYSPCERYRYALTREWGGGGRVAFVMLNPSTATEAQNDPTVERCERRARALGFGGLRVVNIFAWRSTDPKALYRLADPVGPANDAAILEAADWAGMVLCAWGTHGALGGRGAAVAALLGGGGRVLHHLGLTRAGAPRHPLYIAYARLPQVWKGGAG